MQVTIKAPHSSDAALSYLGSIWDCVRYVACKFISRLTSLVVEGTCVAGSASMTGRSGMDYGNSVHQNCGYPALLEKQGLSSLRHAIIMQLVRSLFLLSCCALSIPPF